MVRVGSVLPDVGRRQYDEDLAALGRIEEARGTENVDFFLTMADLSRSRREEGV